MIMNAVRQEAIEAAMGECVVGLQGTRYTVREGEEHIKHKGWGGMVGALWLTSMGRRRVGAAGLGGSREAGH